MRACAAVFFWVSSVLLRGSREGRMCGVVAGSASWYCASGFPHRSVPSLGPSHGLSDFD
jgi:hypothetical protein